MPPRPRRVRIVAALVVAAVAGLGRPPPSHARDGGGPARSTQTTRRSGPIRIDGRLDEPAWQRVPVSGDFWQRQPNEGAPPGQRTEFRIAHDDDAIYVGVRAFDTEADQIRSLLHRRDQESGADWIGVMIDSYRDRRTAFGFALNAAGVQRDVLLYDDTKEDGSWDAVWSGDSHVDADGWTAEFRIPLGQLRFAERDEHAWGVQVMRYVGRTGEQDLWSPVPRDVQGFVSRFGELQGLRGLRGGRRLEILPYVSGGLGRAPHAAADPFHDPIDGRYGLGLDAKLGLTSAVTVAATINPDFGQVEADPSQVNLSANETYFAEKRPFFLEGTEVFQFGIGQGDGDGASDSLFYSRRIGAAPHQSIDGDYVDQPTGTTIYGAAKIAGKTAGGWTFGLLDAVTAEEDAAGVTGAVRTTTVVEPLTNYALARATRDLRGGKTTLGVAVTSVVRRLAGTGLAPVLHDQAVTGGLGFTHRFGRDQWSADVRGYGSWVHGTAAAIAATQTEFRHLYQRPDADHLELDPSRTSLTGAGLVWDVGRFGGKHWSGGVGGDLRSPGFEANDLGFHGPVDYAVQWLFAGYRDDEPGDRLQSWRVNLNTYAVADLAPTLLNFGGNVNGHVGFANFWSGFAGAGVDANRLDPRGTRGGPALAGDPAGYGFVGISTDARKSVSVEVAAEWRRTFQADDTSSSIRADLRIQARSNVELYLGPSYRASVSHDQYVEAAVDDQGQAHYVFARIDQETLGLTVRGAWTFTPDLSLQVYAQPFVAAGAYRDYQQAAATRSRDHDARFVGYRDLALTRADDVYLIDEDLDGAVDYAVAVPDFNLRELRSNLVLRWQYRPGSTAFIIWSHGQRDAIAHGGFELGRDLRALGRAEAEDVVMIKASYWLGM